MITFIDTNGSVVGVAQNLYEFHYLYRSGHYFIINGIISSPTDYGAVAGAISKLLRNAEVKSYA